MKIRKRILVIFVSILLLSIIFFLLTRKPVVYIYSENVSTKKIEVIKTKLTTNFPDIVFKIEDDYTKSNLIFTYDKSSLNPKTLNELDVFISLPSSFIKSGKIDRLQKFLPLELNQTELLLHNSIYNKLFIDEMINENEYIEELDNYISQHTNPLVIAAKDDQTFIDFISLLILTNYSSDELYQFYKDMDNNNDVSIKIQSILDDLIELRAAGVLHKEWLDFDKNTVLSFLENNIAVAGVISLEDHRDYPTKVIKNFTALPYPDNKDNKFAKDLLVKVLYVAVNGDISRIKSMDKIVNFLIDEGFQKELTYSSGLAPINPTVIPMDKQAADLRFWGAASAQLVDSYIFSNTKESTQYISKLRNYLIQKKYQQ